MLQNVIEYRHTIVNAALGFAFLGVIAVILVAERIGDR